MLDSHKSTPKRRNKLLLIFAIFIIFLGTYLYIKNTSSVCPRLKCVSFYNQEKYEPQNIYTETQGLFSALYSHEKSMLRVDIQAVPSQGEATASIDAFIAQMRGLYENAPAPYPGDATRGVVCAKEFVPSFATDTVAGIQISHFSAHLTNRFTYGACIEDLLEYRAVVAMFYCPKNKQVIRLEWIMPKNQAPQDLPPESVLVRSLRCI